MTDKYKEQEDNYLHSTYFEKLVEHLFVADLLETAWLQSKLKIEISRAEIDHSGYDLILECNGIIRHVQLKSSDEKSIASSQNINVKLKEKPSGCIVWIVRKIDNNNSGFNLSYSFFGGEPGKELPDLDKFRIAKHTKADATGKKKFRINTKVIPKGQFKKIRDTKELLNMLFKLTL